MGLNAYDLSERSYKNIVNLAEQVFILVIRILPVGRV